jgi:hypothetical protein
MSVVTKCETKGLKLCCAPGSTVNSGWPESIIQYMPEDKGLSGTGFSDPSYK